MPNEGGFETRPYNNHGWGGEQTRPAAPVCINSPNAHQPAAAADLAAAAALSAAAVLAASSARALRSLRGTARTGLLLGERLTTPAASRKRSTRSVGCAPLASQVFARSRSSLMRSGFSFGSSGLK